MNVRYIVVENHTEKDIAKANVSHNSEVIPIKGDELILSNKDNHYKEKYYKVIKRVIDIIYSENTSEINSEPYEIKLYIKEIQK